LSARRWQNQQTQTQPPFPLPPGSLLLPSPLRPLTRSTSC
jgi:hypothetical protein